MSQNVNVPLSQGDDTARTWQVTAAGSPLNLSGVTVAAVIKPDPSTDDDAPSGVHVLTEGSGLTIVDAALGRVKADIPAAVTTNPGYWYYKIRITVSGDTETAVDGWITVADT